MLFRSTVAIQDTQHRVFLFIQYLYPDETRPETRKRQKRWADLREAKVGEPLQCVAQFPATLVCNRPNFLFMHGNFLIFLQETVHLLTFKMYGDRLPTSSTEEIMPFFAKLVSCPVSGQQVQFPAINIESRNFNQSARLNGLPRLSRCGLATVLYGIRAKW